MMNEKAIAYLKAITLPLAPGGVEILSEVTPVGMTYVVVPKSRYDYGTLIGEAGFHAETIRTMMRIWASVHTNPIVSINVLVPNPRLIKTEYV